MLIVLYNAIKYIIRCAYTESKTLNSIVTPKTFIFEYSFTYCSYTAEIEFDDFLKKKMGYTEVDNWYAVFETPGTFYAKLDYSVKLSIYEDHEDVYKINCHTLIDLQYIEKQAHIIHLRNQYTAKQRAKREAWQDKLLSQGYYDGWVRRK